MKTLKSFLVLILGFLSSLYILNPGLGIFEIIPDNLPFVGNLDEGLATVLLIWALKYFGLIKKSGPGNSDL